MFKYRQKLAINLLLMLAVAAVDVYVPIQTGNMVDCLTHLNSSVAERVPAKEIVTAQTASQDLAQHIMFAVGLGAAQAALGFCSSYYSQLVNEQVMFDLKLEFFQALLSREMEFFDAHHSGKLSHLLSSELTIVRNIITIYAITLVRASLAGAFSLVYMFLVSWKLALLVLLASPLIGASSAMLAQKRNKREAMARDALARASVVSLL
jgi:ABC-type multidrug transport system fused ATPase/permease subunit